MLNVFTYLNEMRPALWNSINFLYIAKGVEPVGRPRTKKRSGPALKSLIRFMTYFALHSPTQGLVGKITNRIVLFLAAQLGMKLKNIRKILSKAVLQPREIVNNKFNDPKDINLTLKVESLMKLFGLRSGRWGKYCVEESQRELSQSITLNW